MHKLYNALTTQYSENASGYPVLKPVLELYNRFLGAGSYIKSLLTSALRNKRKVKKSILQCVSKNIPDIFSCNSRKHCRIFIMFGTHVTEKVSNQ